jgi:hypothetical protein
MRAFAVLLLVTVCLTGCTLPNTLPPSNSSGALVITQTNSDPSSVNVVAGESLRLSVATNKGSGLTTQWSADGGILSSSAGNPVSWVAPGTPGTYHVDVTVSDGAQQASAEFRFVVK